jgi:hypothetical protein
VFGQTDAALKLCNFLLNSCKKLKFFSVNLVKTQSRNSGIVLLIFNIVFGGGGGGVMVNFTPVPTLPPGKNPSAD